MEDLCESKATLVYTGSSRIAGIYSETLPLNCFQTMLSLKDSGSVLQRAPSHAALFQREQGRDAKRKKRLFQCVEASKGQKRWEINTSNGEK